MKRRQDTVRFSSHLLLKKDHAEMTAKTNLMTPKERWLKQLIASLVLSLGALTLCAPHASFAQEEEVAFEDDEADEAEAADEDESYEDEGEELSAEELAALLESEELVITSESDEEGAVEVNLSANGEVEVKTPEAEVKATEQGAEVKTAEAEVKVTEQGAEVKTAEAEVKATEQGAEVKTPETTTTTAVVTKTEAKASTKGKPGKRRARRAAKRHEVGVVTFKSAINGKLFIDGRMKGPLRAGHTRTFPVKAGRHSFRLISKGQAHSTSANVPAGRKLSFQISEDGAFKGAGAGKAGKGKARKGKARKGGRKGTARKGARKGSKSAQTKKAVKRGVKKAVKKRAQD